MQVKFQDHISTFFLGYRLRKGQKSAISAIFGLTVFKELSFDTQKMLSGSWNFFWASPTVFSRNSCPWFIHPWHIMAMSPALKQFLYFQGYFLNARFHTDQRTDKASYRVAFPQLKNAWNSKMCRMDWRTDLWKA